MSEGGIAKTSSEVSNDSLCPRCGLTLGQVGSLTFWIFQDARCSCDTAGVPTEPQESLVRSARAQKTSEKQILDERYELLVRVGHGSIGLVYKARDLTNGQIVALKIIRPEQANKEAAVKRLLQEVAIVAAISHTNIGQVYGYGIEKDGLPYLVMEFVEGENLEERLKAAGKVAQSRAVDLFLQISAGLICAHMNGIIHRDLKPSNIILKRETNGQDTAIIVDFGFAGHLRSDDKAVRLTQEGEVFGSPAYMSPEQCLGGNVDVRSDIYSFGCLMYEVLTGTLPLVGENVLSTVAKQVSETAVSMRVYNPSISESIDALVLKCLNKEPLYRYQSVSELRQDLDKVKKGESITVKQPHDRDEVKKRSRDNKPLRAIESVYRNVTSLFGAIVLAAVSIGAITGISVWTVMQRNGGPSQTANSHSGLNNNQSPLPADNLESGVSASIAHQIKTTAASAAVIHQSNNLRRRAAVPVQSIPHNAAARAALPKQKAAPSDHWDQLKSLRMHK